VTFHHVLFICHMAWKHLITLLIQFVFNIFHLILLKDRRGRDHMVDGFPTTCAISAYHHQSCVSSNPTHDKV
jgi:hypothetical protein